MKISTIVRALLTIALLVGVYFETGIFTTITLGLTALYAEVSGFLLRKAKFN